MNDSPRQSKWYDKTWLVVLLCIIFFPVGLYGLWKNESISIGWQIGTTALLAIAVIGQIENYNNGSSSSINSSSNSSEQKVEEPKGVGVGEVLHTDYFDIKVNKVNLSDGVNTGNQFADIHPENGNRFLIINASFKNTDSESRMLMDGSVWINYKGKAYEFDKTETIMLEGWGLLLDQINPLITKTTNLVYKIPAEINGPAYWQPGRADSDQIILLGNLK
jgi:hypothetical protein